MLYVESTTMEEVLIEMVRELDSEEREVLSQNGRHSRNKGKRGEREVAKIFQKPVSMPDVLSSITAGQVLRQML